MSYFSLKISEKSRFRKWKLSKTPDAERFEGERRDRDDTADDASANQRVGAAFRTRRFLEASAFP